MSEAPEQPPIPPATTAGPQHHGMANLNPSNGIDPWSLASLTRSEQRFMRGIASALVRREGMPRRAANGVGLHAVYLRRHVLATRRLSPEATVAHGPIGLAASRELMEIQARAFGGEPRAKASSPLVPPPATE